MDIAAKKMKPKPEEYFSAEEYEWLQKVAAYDRDDPERFVFADDGEVAEVCSNYADDILNEEDDWFFALHLEEDSDYVPKYADSPEFGRVLVLGLRWCVDAWENVDAARWLGFLHQIGRFVEKDAQEAARLYRFCESKGDRQSMINLGYLYEYGHLDEPDYEASFKQFAKVMALGDFPEAIYKVGDAYFRARVVERDLRTAYKLYKKCYDNCGDLIGAKANVAFRLAELVIDSSNKEWDTPYDPVLALHYYQVAEIGLRIEVVNDSPWYAERLEQAIAGQDRARSLMDEMGVDLAAKHRMFLP